MFFQSQNLCSVLLNLVCLFMNLFLQLGVGLADLFSLAECQPVSWVSDVDVTVQLMSSALQRVQQKQMGTSTNG